MNNSNTADDGLKIPALEVMGAVKSFGEVQVLRGVDLSSKWGNEWH